MFHDLSGVIINFELIDQCPLHSSVCFIKLVTFSNISLMGLSSMAESRIVNLIPCLIIRRTSPGGFVERSHSIISPVK